MQKELLLAISDDRASSYNLRLLKEVFENFCDLQLTLFYVAPRKTSWEMGEKALTPVGNDLSELVAHTKSKGEKTLEEARKWLLEMAGCSEANVEIKLVHSRKGTVSELIDEARSGLYDAMLLGRKGFTWFEEVFENSVCHELLWRDIDFPIWICKRPPDNPRHNVLLCLDGSAASLRMVDHAGYMLADEEKHTITLFHVAEEGYKSAHAERIFGEGLALLAENNIDEERVELKVVTTGTPIKAILKEAVEGQYLAVGVGKRGMGSPSKIEGLFPSSVTVNLLRQLTDMALWISK